MGTEREIQLVANALEIDAYTLAVKLHDLAEKADESGYYGIAGHLRRFEDRVTSAWREFERRDEDKPCMGDNIEDDHDI